eukprot:15710-Pelagomonas_calceolata.AAC.1
MLLHRAILLLSESNSSLLLLKRSSEYNQYLPSDSAESRKLKAQEEGPEALEKLTLKDKDGNEIEKQLPGGKVKKKQKPQGHIAHMCVSPNWTSPYFVHWPRIEHCLLNAAAFQCLYSMFYGEISAMKVVIDVNTRNKKKMITTVTGLELFGVKLAEASKLFGKKFACGCSVTKSATGTEQIDMQVFLSCALGLG